MLANILFNRSVVKDVKLLLTQIPKRKSEIIRQEDLTGLPSSVQKWLERSQVIGKERITSVRLRQKGWMRIKEDGPWMPVEAEQYFTVDEPAFVWKAKVKMAPLLYFSGKDRYYVGKGAMQIRILSLLPIVNAQGKEVDQGSMLRYLAEIQWFPTAALCNYIQWEEIDAYSARATMSYKGVTASGVFTFNEQGDLVEFVAKRYREVNGSYILQDWGGITKDYREFNGIRIPNKSEIIWKQDTGDFNWFKCEIADIEYNNLDIY